MKMNRLLAVACAASLMAAAGCSSSSDNGSSSGKSGSSNGNGSSNTASNGKTEPSNGVLPNTSPMPMPEAGKRYDNPQPRDKVKQGGTLTLPLVSIPTNYNSYNVDGNSVYNSQIEYFTSPATNLWEFSVGGEVKPNSDYLSKVELVKKSPETVKVTINSKAKWNNGDPITWKAVETAWKTQSGTNKKFSPAATDGFSNIKSVTKGDSDKQAVVTFKTPTYPYQLAIGLENPKNADPTFYNKGWVGKAHNELRAGPYKIQKATKSQITLVPNSNWWGPKPKLDKIVYKQMEDTASINAFQNGEIDAAPVANADRLKQIKDMKGIHVEIGFQTATSVYTMGQTSSLFKNDYAREAFELGTDRKTLAKVRFQGMDWKETPPGSALMYPWQNGYQDNMKELHFNQDKAKKLMEDHGWKMGSSGYFEKNGKTAEFNYVTFGDDPTQKAISRAQQQMSKQVGLKMNIDNRKSAQFSDTLTKRNFDVVAMGWSGSDPFGWFWMCQIYCSDSPSNYSGLGNKTLDKQLKKPQTIPDAATAAKMGNTAEAKVLKLGGTFPLWNGPTMYGVKDGLANTNNAFSQKVSGFYSAKPYNVGWQK